jgi:hypothetical protein
LVFLLCRHEEEYLTVGAFFLNKFYFIGNKNNRDDAEEVSTAEYWAKVFSGSVDQGDDPMEPVSDILYPVIDRFDKIQIITDKDDTNVTDSNVNNKVVAVLAGVFYWRDVLKNVLPDGKKGLVVVIENTCTSTFTYQIE